MTPAMNIAERPEKTTGINGRITQKQVSQLKNEIISHASENINSVNQKVEASPTVLMENVVEAGAHNVQNIDSAHDFNLARVLELLSDPILQEDIPDE